MFEKATKKSCNLWCAIYGTSGAGKTMTALRIASGLGGKIAVIDTERGSSVKYADRFAFDVCVMKDNTIDAYLKQISEAGAAGYNVLIIDSMSHAWGELIDEVEQIAKLKYNGNTFRAWAEGTPKQKLFINGVLSFPGHVIATMRSKTEWAVEQNDKGKMTPRKLGLAPEQGKNIEYEFDLLLEMNQEHVAKVGKDRTGKYQDQFILKPDETFGAALGAWVKGETATNAALQTAKNEPQSPTSPEAKAANTNTPPANNEVKKDASPAKPEKDKRVSFFWGVIKNAGHEAAFRVDDMKALSDIEKIEAMRSYCLSHGLWAPKGEAKSPLLMAIPNSQPVLADPVQPATTEQDRSF